MRTSIALLILGFLLTTGVAVAGDGHELSVEGEIETPTQEESLPEIGDEVTINSAATVDQGEQITVTASQATTDQPAEVQLRDIEEPEAPIAFEPFEGTDETVTFDTDSLDPGSYVLLLQEGGDFHTAVPVVVAGYDLTVEHPTEATVDDEITVTVEVTDEQGDTSFGSIEVTAHHDDSDDPIVETADHVGDDQYEATLELPDAVDYDVYAAALDSEETDDGYPIILGAAEGETISVSSADDGDSDDDEQDSDDGDDGDTDDGSDDGGTDSGSGSDTGDTGGSTGSGGVSDGTGDDGSDEDDSENGDGLDDEEAGSDDGTTGNETNDDESASDADGDDADETDSGTDEQPDNVIEQTETQFAGAGETQSVATVEQTTVDEIEIATADADGTVTVSTVSDLPDEIESASRVTVSMTTIQVPEEVADTPGTITSSIDTETLDAANVDPADLQLFRYDAEATEWTSLETDLVEETDDAVVIEAATPGFSYFELAAISEPDAALALPDQLLVGEELEFDASDSTDRYGELTAFEWEIDGETLHGETVATEFADDGEYTASLTVTNDAGETNTVTESFVVESDGGEADTDDNGDTNGDDGDEADDTDDDAETNETDDSDADDDGAGMGVVTAVLAMLGGVLYLVGRNSHSTA